FGYDVSCSQMVENLGRDKFVSDAAIITAHYADEYADGLLFSFHGTWAFEGHAYQSVRRPQFFAAKVQATFADIDDLVWGGCAAGPIESDQTGNIDALA